PKQTRRIALHMSASGGKADIRKRSCLLSRSLLGAKRTSLFAAHMSAYDPKRTSPPSRVLGQTATMPSKIRKSLAGDQRQENCCIPSGHGVSCVRPICEGTGTTLNRACVSLRRFRHGVARRGIQAMPTRVWLYRGAEHHNRVSMGRWEG